MHVLAWVLTIEKVLTEEQSNMMKIRNNLKKKSNLITQCLLHTIHSNMLWKSIKKYWNIVDKLFSLSIKIQRLLLMISDWWEFDMKNHVTVNISKSTWWIDHNQTLQVTFNNMLSSVLTLYEFKTIIETLNHHHYLFKKIINATIIESEVRISHQNLLCLHQQLVIHYSSSLYQNHRLTIDFRLKTTFIFFILSSYLISTLLSANLLLHILYRFAEHELALC